MTCLLLSIMAKLTQRKVNCKFRKLFLISLFAADLEIEYICYEEKMLSFFSNVYLYLNIYYL